MRGTTDLSLAARKNLDPFLALVDSAQPVFDSQTNTSSEIQMWARHIADVTGSLETHDDSVAGFIDNGDRPLRKPVS